MHIIEREPLQRIQAAPPTFQLGNLGSAHYPGKGNNRRYAALQQWINSRESDVLLSDASSEDTIELELSAQQALSLSRVMQQRDRIYL